MKAVLAVTTSGKADPALIARARAAAQKWGIPFLPRRPKEPFAALWPRAGALWVWGRGKTELWDEQGSLAWSPGMAALRLKRFEAGDIDDGFLRATDLRPGDAVADCTLGLGQDALLAARAVGPKGRVVGVESSLPLCALVSEGLRRREPGPHACHIHPAHARAEDFLAAQAPGAFDVVFFDPMFQRARAASGSFEALRRFADPAPLTPELLALGRRVARRHVVVKAARYFSGFKALDLEALPGSRFSALVWARAPPLER